MAAHSNAFLTLVTEAKARIKQVHAREMPEILQKDPRAKLIDTREESEYARGHLPGAVHIGKGVLERDIEAKVPDPAAPIVLYCGGGYRSALAADVLQKMGYADVVSMDGGWRGWNDAGYGTE